MSASGRTSAPVAACGILVALGAPDSYIFIYSAPGAHWRFTNAASSGKVGPASRSPQAAAKAKHFEWRSTAILGHMPLMAIRSTFPAAAGGRFSRCTVSFRQGGVRAEDPRKYQPLRGLRLSSRPGWLLWAACGSGTSSGALGLPGRPRMFPDRTDLAT